MSESRTYTRRHLFRQALTIGGVAGLITGNESFGAMCRLTAAQGEGPYYPEGDLNRDNDLTNLGPGKPMAKGQVIYLSGLIQDEKCAPIPGAVIEVWQAAASGKYNHSQDPNTLPLDPAFQYWGRTRTDAKGAYLFKSVVPGHYPTSPNTYRPPHIHVKLHAANHYSLTTQIYFDPRSYDDPNVAKLVQRLNQAENVRSDLLVLYRPFGVDPGTKAGRFDFTMKSH